MEKIGYYQDHKMIWTCETLDKTDRVYMISFPGNGKYIGSTGNIKKRFMGHVGAFEKNAHSNKKLQEAFDTYGRFELYELEKIAPGAGRTIREQFYIDILRPELNIAPAGLHYDSGLFFMEISNLIGKVPPFVCPHCGKALNVKIE